MSFSRRTFACSLINAYHCFNFTVYVKIRFHDFGSRIFGDVCNTRTGILRCDEFHGVQIKLDPVEMEKKLGSPVAKL